MPMSGGRMQGGQVKAEGEGRDFPQAGRDIVEGSGGVGTNGKGGKRKGGKG